MSFLGVLGSIGKAIGGVVAGVATGGPVGGIVGGLTAITAGSGGGGVRPASALPVSSFRVPTSGLSLTGGYSGIPTFAALPGGPGGPGPGAGSAMIPHLACGVGYHHAKHKGALGGLLASKCVKNRHMNVTNPRALRRSIRRLKGFEKLARTVLHITSPRKKHVFGGPRARRRKR